ncbi:hypothetical protein ACSBR2_003890 [Camellia fascicularis]
MKEDEETSNPIKDYCFLLIQPPNPLWSISLEDDNNNPIGEGTLQGVKAYGVGNLQKNCFGKVKLLKENRFYFPEDIPSMWTDVHMLPSSQIFPKFIFLAYFLGKILSYRMLQSLCHVSVCFLKTIKQIHFNDTYWTPEFNLCDEKNLFILNGTLPKIKIAVAIVSSFMLCYVLSLDLSRDWTMEWKGNQICIFIFYG